MKPWTSSELVSVDKETSFGRRDVSGMIPQNDGS